MEENRLKKLYLRLSMTSIFRNVLKKPVFVHFFDYARSASTEDKIASYSAMVSDIYNEGGSLTDYVSKLVFEDENVYVKQKAKKITVSSYVERTVREELSVLSEFASLKPEDFSRDMDIDFFCPEFSSCDVELYGYYHSRIEEIDKYG